MLTIVMYHYVRDAEETSYPKINAINLENFESQLEFATQQYTVCSPQQVISAAMGEGQLPLNACMLTFDDGFSDHYRNVFPRLRDRGLSGCFCPSAAPIREGVVLDVHKIQFIISSAESYSILADDLLAMIDEYRPNHAIPAVQELQIAFQKEGRLDPPELMFVKGILQRGIPQEVRSKIVGRMFSRYVSENEKSFSQDLYMDLEQLRLMAIEGMVIGGHGFRHLPMQELSRECQQNEIDGTLELLNDVYPEPVTDWVMCYPWGTYNQATIELLEANGCALGMAYGERPVKDLSQRFELTRVDAVNFGD